jgi:hypothetical protein
VIVTLDGKALANVGELLPALRRRRTQGYDRARNLRDGEERTVTATLRNRPG